MDRISPDVADYLKSEIAAAEGREVSFVAVLDSDGVICSARAVARGTVDCVLALPGIAQRGEMVLHNHPGGVLEPSHADLNVAARMHDGGVGFGIVNNQASELYVVVEVPKSKAARRLDPVGVSDMLGPEGPVAAGHGNFEDRVCQRDMASYIADVYNDGGVALLEAGTGVGKSFAYLVPAIEWSRANGERTVVSTNTINLQEQLTGKDLPFLADALDGPDGKPTFAMLKGWRNYVCLVRLETASSGQASLLEPEKHDELRSISNWAAKTSDGSLADLPSQPSAEVWDEVSAEADLCTRLKCPHFDDCFVFAARRRAAEADVVVVNHHLLAADLAVRGVQDNWQEAAVLPPYNRLVIDEAHHLEDIAGQHMGSRVTAIGVHRLFSRLERNGKGLVPALMADLVRQSGSTGQASLDLLRETVLPALAEARLRADGVFNYICQLVSGSDSQVRLMDDFTGHPIWGEGLGVALDNFVQTLASIREGVEVVGDRMELESDFESRARLLIELRGVIRRLASVMDGLLLTLRPKSSSHTVRWIERTGKRPLGTLPFPVSLTSVPLDVAGVLRDTLFDNVDTVVLTSATLATGGSFDFLKSRIGLDKIPGKIRYEEILESPFDYPRQCLLEIPTGMPNPQHDQLRHDRAMVDVISDLAEISDGGVFVLFTSYAMLRRIASALREAIGSRWPMLVQGEGQRDKLLWSFRESGSAILLGTDSFWEGVDVPGAALRSLVIAKLPFKVPTEPLTAARLDLLREEGSDGFMSYQVPQASLKLKQGFGRLIRSKTDFGVVVLMDERIVSKRYGKSMLESLPPAERLIGPWPELRDRARKFFEERSAEEVRDGQ